MQVGPLQATVACVIVVWLGILFPAVLRADEVITQDERQLRPDTGKLLPEAHHFSPQRPGKPASVEGQVLRIEEDAYVIRESSGQEVRLQVDNLTRFTAIPKLGDNVHAEVTPQGHALTITAR